MPIEDAAAAICDSPVRVLRGRDVREAQVYQTHAGNFVYWSPFTGERVVIDRNRLLRKRWPKPPRSCPPEKAYTPGTPDQMEQQRLKRGVTATALHRWRKEAYRDVIEELHRDRKWVGIPACPVGTASLVPYGPATHNHHIRGRAGTLLIDKRFFMAVSYAGDKWIHRPENRAEAQQRGWLAADADWGVAPDDAVTEALRRRLEPV